MTAREDWTLTTIFVLWVLALLVSGIRQMQPPDGYYVPEDSVRSDFSP